ncbi:protein THEM6-like isoform X1 [Python bivittatus]|uniref:Protein THEM6 n=2 Tax=Python bivittatus TaxID=176946 RepID=A0A9F2R1D5_PYTBI|nr:protein THEM6-like isoform X1 [Python bivittatus]
MEMLLWVICLAATICFAFLDGWYLLRFLIIVFYNSWVRPRTGDLLEEFRFHSWVLPTDLDFMGHMNNARYPREADFARYAYMSHYHLVQTLWALKGSTVLTASCCRYRRSLHLWERFTIHTRMVGWDEHAFYLEQQFISAQDGFLCAVLLARHHVTGPSPSEVIQRLYGRKVESPEVPEDVHYWLKSNQASSQRLRVESDLQKNGKTKSCSECEDIRLVGGRHVRICAS